MAHVNNCFMFWIAYFVHYINCSYPVKSNAKSILELSEAINPVLYTTNLEGQIKHNFEDVTTEIPKIRIKRQSGGGKYTEAAKMPQVKVLRLWLQMFRNAWTTTYVGGAHPLHHEVPKPFVELFGSKIIKFFFPPIGAEADKTA